MKSFGNFSEFGVFYIYLQSFILSSSQNYHKDVCIMFVNSDRSFLGESVIVIEASFCRIVFPISSFDQLLTIETNNFFYGLASGWYFTENSSLLGF